MIGLIDYLLIGHITADIKRGGRVLGGTVSYAAPVARAFGHRVGIVTSAAACEPLLAQLIPYAEISIRVTDETTTFENIYEQGTRIQYVHELAASLEHDAIPVGFMSAPLVHLAPLVEEVDPNIARHFPDATVLLTPQGWMRRWDKDGRVFFKRWFDEDVLQSVDMVVFSKQDIADAPELELEFAGAVEHLLVTNGEHGGTYYHNGEPYPYAPHNVKELEPTGAGDVFATALLSSLPLLQNDVHRAVTVAARLAAISVTRASSLDSVHPDEVAEALDLARQKQDHDRPDTL